MMEGVLGLASSLGRSRSMHIDAAVEDMCSRPARQWLKRRIENRADTGQQLSEAKWLGDVVIGAQFEPHHAVDLVATLDLW
jgi:hypothetical protein